MVGASESKTPAGTNATNALILKLTRNGALDTSFGNGGTVQVDLGGTADWFYGTTLLRTGKVAVSGYKGNVPADTDDAAIARFDVGYVSPVPVASIAGVKHNAKLTRGPARSRARSRAR